jgi:translation initiation factor IF-2
MTTRPPVITILGHVDHGKTTLLDQIRSSHIASKEAGGITQHIGAYQVEYQGRPLTFIDTPGHAAFSSMRRRGGAVADIAILVVAADDGVMPQTKESIEHIKAAGIPYIVAINKIDLEGVNTQKIKSGLAEIGEYVEGFGGNTPVVEISAKTGKNLDTLLETLILLADLQELKDNRDDTPTAIVIESKIDPHKGPVATLLVKSGIFCSRQALYNSHGKLIGKTRAMFDFTLKEIEKAYPSTPIQVIGLSEVLAVGDTITTDSCAKLDPCQSNHPISSTKNPSDICFNIILKGDVAGSLEAITNSLPEKINLVSFDVGQVTESDVHQAQTENALIVCFNTKASAQIKKLAQTDGVEIITFNIIYELFDHLNDLLKKNQAIAEKPEIGQAKILKVFQFGLKTVYGCLVTSGKLRLGDTVNEAKITSLQFGKKPVEEVKKNAECGFSLEPSLDFKEGDVIKSHSN